MNSTTEREAFLRAIAGSPDDDAPRLVFADWLDEHGEPARAEFIRVQVERARLEAADEPAPISDRERALFDAHGTAWLAELPVLQKAHWGPDHPEKFNCTNFQRGFVGRVTFRNLVSFRHQADTVFAATPAPVVSFDTLSPNMAAQLAKLPQLLRIHHLDLRDTGPNEEGLTTLLCSPHLGNLRSLVAIAGEIHDWPGWSPRTANRLGPPPAPPGSIAAGLVRIARARCVNGSID